MVFKIFVSYSTNDLKQVESLRDQLSLTPIDVFVAEHSIAPSQELGSTISRAISECDLFVVIWSENAKNSDWVSQEIGKAHALDKIILPLVLNDDMGLPGFISSLKYLVISEGHKEPLVEAQKLIMSEYKNKKNMLENAEKIKQKDKDKLFAMGVGAVLLWAVS